MPLFEHFRGKNAANAADNTVNAAKDNTVVYVQITPAISPDAAKGHMGHPSRMLAAQLVKLASELDIRQLPGIPVHDHFKPVREAKAKVEEVKQVHKLCTQNPNLSQKEAKSRVRLGANAPKVKLEPTVEVVPVVQKSVALEGADGIAKLVKRNVELERILWDKMVAYEVHICNLFDKMFLRKTWMGWNAAVTLEVRTCEKEHMETASDIYHTTCHYSAEEGAQDHEAGSDARRLQVPPHLGGEPQGGEAPPPSRQELAQELA